MRMCNVYVYCVYVYIMCMPKHILKFLLYYLFFLRTYALSQYFHTELNDYYSTTASGSKDSYTFFYGVFAVMVIPPRVDSRFFTDYDLA